MDELQEDLLIQILSFYSGRRSDLIPILLEVQANFRHVPPEAISLVARFLGMTEGEVYAVASFYNQFRLAPLGRHVVTVCRGTTCHIRGAPQILDEAEESLGISGGETRQDQEYTLDTVACIGCCALAPCLKVNEAVHGGMTPEKTRQLFNHDGSHCT